MSLLSLPLSDSRSPVSVVEQLRLSLLCKWVADCLTHTHTHIHIRAHTPPFACSFTDCWLPAPHSLHAGSQPSASLPCSSPFIPLSPHCPLPLSLWRLQISATSPLLFLKTFFVHLYLFSLACLIPFPSLWFLSALFSCQLSLLWFYLLFLCLSLYLSISLSPLSPPAIHPSVLCCIVYCCLSTVASTDVSCGSTERTVSGCEVFSKPCWPASCAWLTDLLALECPCGNFNAR